MDRLRLLHTGDWHLGHALRDFSRGDEHDAFLAWLLNTIKAESIDALLICGDVFHTANPGASAQAAWYRFLAEARSRYPDLDVVVIGGNHDSAARLDATRPLLDLGRIHVVGGVARTPDGDIDADAMVVPLCDKYKQPRAWVAAVPFLRRSDLPLVDDADPLVGGVREVYRRVISAAKKKQFIGQATIAMGHCYMTGTSLSETSERRILGGNQHALGTDIFPSGTDPDRPALAYVALGHLHLAQMVGSPAIRYSGSPIPLSMAETEYEHQVAIVDIDVRANKVADWRALRVPRHVDMVRIGPLPLEQALVRIGDLPALGDPRPAPFVEITVQIESPDPSLRRQVEEALRDRRARLVAVRVERVGTADALGDAIAGATLTDLDPVEVFRKRYAQAHHGEVPPDLMSAFEELLDGLSAEAVSPWDRLGDSAAGPFRPESPRA